ncbi:MULTISPECIES: substrate-binding periplasmic protein [Pseudomonas]|uniref:Solute-binding protein family 3/N-terminal domain-containing protein n=1 Tax=Pseudomonas abyssi TaxID=170540 RepID=A0A395R1L8_9PSED|nr:transporter substrate-binding domain-containing protein [Halopseudomonas gallaeciensis]MAG66294.1 hypothetical protein [Pseudomonadales bacterium]RGP54026.1 hypothetical protein ASB58_13715 [Halopseudomonas gallaeciensis]
MQHFQTLAGLLLMLAATHTAYAQEAAPVEFALADFPPYFQIDERNEPSGPVLELVAALFAEAEQPHIVRGYPAARLYQRLERGETAVSMGGAGHPEMARTSLRGRAPIFTVELNIYRKPQQPQVRQPAELAGKSVILISGYTYGALAQQLMSPASGARVAHAASHSSGLQMLLHDRAHYLIDYADPMRGLLENLPDNSITSDPLVQIPVYLFVSRAFPDGQALLQRLDAAFSALEQRGEVQRILATTAYSP